MSGPPITYLMWKYQPHFRAAAKHFAERIFKDLDQLFEPQLFLVGILADRNLQRFPACVEPEKDFWIHSERFNGVLALAQTRTRHIPKPECLNPILWLKSGKIKPYSIDQSVMLSGRRLRQSHQPASVYATSSHFRPG